MKDFSRFEMDDIRRLEILQEAPQAIISYEVGRDRQSREESFLGAYRGLAEAVKNMPSDIPVNFYRANTQIV